MAENGKLARDAYMTRNVGDFPGGFELLGRSYAKIEDLRYGTNPHQPAAWYRPNGLPCPVGSMAMLKSGKSGLSQTNLEDISQALSIVKYFDSPACAIMKHVNPCGAATGAASERLRDLYLKARDCDPRAAFGGVVAFNVKVDAATAEEIMGTFIECVVAPEFDPGAMTVFNDSEAHKINKHIRVVRCGNLSHLPKFVGDDISGHLTVKALADGCLVLAHPLLTRVRTVADLKKASAESARLGHVESTVAATDAQLRDLLAAWHINLSVRSNGVVIVKNGHTLAVGTGEQDRVGAVEQAVWKMKNKYEGEETPVGAVMSSDGFFPFADAAEAAAEAGIAAVAAPSGSLRDAEVILRANELGVSLLHAPERVFSHH